MNLFKHLFRLIIIVLILWSSWRVYTYFFDIKPAIVTITGIHDNDYCSDDICCCIESDKSGTLSLWIDGHAAAHSIKIKANKPGYSFTIPTKTLSNGKHMVKAEFTDSTFNQNAVHMSRDFYVDNMPLQAVFIKGVEAKVFQGRTLHIQFQVNKEIQYAHLTALSHSFECYPESKNSTIYEAFIPIECEEQPNEYLLSIEIEDKVGNGIRLDNKFQVVAYPFKKETITVAHDKVQEEKALGKDGKELEEMLVQLALQSPHEKLWKGNFCTPIEIQRITCEYGTIRTTQHKGRYAHKAVDMINAPRSVVWAPQDGIIVLKDRFGPSGNTVVIDHGLGVLSLFYHLHNFADIEIGQKIVQGNPIGELGKTGFATGYHLHWEVRINNIPVDPLQWVQV